MITLSPSIPGQGNYKIMLEKTGPNAAYVSFDSWPDGVPAEGTPTKHEEYDLTNVSIVGGTADADTANSIMGFHPHVRASASPAGQPTSVNFAITHAFLFNSDVNYPLTQADHDALTAWFVAFVQADA